MKFEQWMEVFSESENEQRIIVEKWMKVECWMKDEEWMKVEQ